MGGNLYLFVCVLFFSLKIPLLKKSTQSWHLAMIRAYCKHSGVPFHNHENVLRLMYAESPASWVSHIPLSSPLLGKTSWFREPTGLLFEKVESEEKLPGSAWVLRNHNKNWQFKHFPGVQTQVRWSSAQGLRRLPCKCWSGLEALGPLLGTWLLLERTSCGCWTQTSNRQWFSDFQKKSKSVIGYKFYQGITDV